MFAYWIDFNLIRILFKSFRTVKGTSDDNIDLCILDKTLLPLSFPH